eukprot:4965595-Pyramimonas_sp.AAC.2
MHLLDEPGVDMNLLDELAKLGYERQVAAEALRRTSNNIQNIPTSANRPQPAGVGLRVDMRRLVVMPDGLHCASALLYCTGSLGV